MNEYKKNIHRTLLGYFIDNHQKRNIDAVTVINALDDFGYLRKENDKKLIEENNQVFDALRFAKDELQEFYVMSGQKQTKRIIDICVSILNERKDGTS